MAAETHTFTGINQDIPDGNLAGLSDSRSITSQVTGITSLRVRLRIAGEFNGDLYGYVRHIRGGRTNLCVLLNRPGRTAANPAGYGDAGVDVVFDAAAANGDIHLYRNVTTPPAGTPLTGDWQPDGRKVEPTVVTELSARTTTLDAFDGADANGEWTLFLVTHTIADSRNATATGTVLVKIKVDTEPSPNLRITDLGNGSFHLLFDGIPGTTYRIEYSEPLEAPIWQSLGSATADAFGRFQFTDTPPLGTPGRIYRSVYP